MGPKTAKQRRKNRKRRISESEFSFEKAPRIASSYTEVSDPKRYKPLLPIKGGDGKIIHQYEEEEDIKLDVDEGIEIDHENESDEIIPEQPVLSVQQRKTQIAKLCSNLINDPQASFNDLKKLQHMMWEKRPVETCVVIRKLAMASLTCVFTDIIPGYRIRERTDEEKSVKLSKDIRSLVDYEEGLLRHYKTFLESLEKVIKDGKRSVKNPLFTEEECKEMVLLAVKSLCELYEKTTHFNFHNNIVMVMVPLANARNKRISEMCCNAIKSIFRSDKSGETSLATIKVLCRLIKNESGSKKGVRPEVLNTFSSLHINHVDFDAMSTNGRPKKLSARDKKKIGDEKKKLSRGQKKHMKRKEKLQSELKAVEATERKENKLKYHTEIIQQVFLVYFRILKQKKGQGRPEKLLNSVLEGLAQFAHLINIDFFNDLIKVLQNLIVSRSLSYRQSLCCMVTAFKVLSGQGEALNIDPSEFYKQLYEGIFQVIHSVKDFTKTTETAGSEKRASDLNLVIDCLNIMLNKRRRQVTLNRLLAFIKRLSSLALNLHPSGSARSVLEIIEKLLNSNSKTSALFDIESQEKGVYLPELDDPEHCGATSACVWELHALRRHFCPDIRSQANKILRESIREQQNR